MRSIDLMLSRFCKDTIKVMSRLVCQTKLKYPQNFNKLGSYKAVSDVRLYRRQVNAVSWLVNRRIIKIRPAKNTSMYKEKLVKSLKILIEIDKLLKKLASVDPYGDMLENFAEFPTKYPPVTKRLIRIVKKDLRDFERG